MFKAAIYNVFLNGAYVGYAWAMTHEEAIRLVAGPDADCPGWTAVR